MNLRELIDELRVYEDKYGDEEISYDAYKNTVQILIGENPDTRVSITIKKADWD